MKVRETIFILGVGDGAPAQRRGLGPRPPTEGEDFVVLKVYNNNFNNLDTFPGDQPCVLHHLHLWLWPRRRWKVDFCWTQVKAGLFTVHSRLARFLRQSRKRPFASAGQLQLKRRMEARLARTRSSSPRSAGPSSPNLDLKSNDLSFPNLEPPLFLVSPWPSPTT